MRGRQYFIIIVLGIIFSFSCGDEFGEQSVDPGAFLPGDGVFIVNEGNFNQGNGSISFYSYDDTSVVHDVFRTVNERPLGDLPVSMVIAGNRFFIAVNHSSRVETGSAESLSTRFTLTGIASPRRFQVIGPDEVAVSDLQTSLLTFFNPETGEMISQTDLGRSSEAMAISGNRLFLSNWSSFYVSTDNRYVMVVDLDSKAVIDSLKTGLEPQSMVRDYLGRIWVLCSGGYDYSELPVLLCFDPVSLQVLHWFEFPSKNRSPQSLNISGGLDTLYYLDSDVYRMPVTGITLPSQAFLPAGGRMFYALGVDPGRGDIFVSDALDYQQRGKVWRYDSKGKLLQEFRAGIIPGSFCFQ